MSDHKSMHEEALHTLQGFVQTMTDEKRDLNSIGQTVMYYGLFLRRILNNKRPAFLNQRNINSPTRLTSGEALTPWHAAACMEDRTRTAAFVRGSVKAVEHTLRECPDRPLHLVEAGCGPLGTLVLPLLARFNSEELVVSLIDLHQESIDCVETMLDHFDFRTRIRQLICGDATQGSLRSPAHLVLTETMHTALGKEPQVAITRALLSRNPQAILVPQSIRVDLALLNLTEEISHFPPKVCERTVVAPVFELNRQTALELTEDNGRLPAARVTLPAHPPPKSTPCLTTTIQVFDTVKTGDYSTQISHPVPLQAQEQPIPPGTTIQFSYKTGNPPGLIGQLTD